MSLTWHLSGAGWADITVADDHAETALTASYVTDAPEKLLTAVARIVTGADETRAEFNAEPTAFRWIFCREEDDVRVRLLRLPDSHKHDEAGTEIWSSRQTVDSVARAVVRCFDDVERRYGGREYHRKWNRHFPSWELEALRTAWRDQAT